MVKSSPAVRETWVPSLGSEDALEKGTDTHSSILAWRIPWTEEPGGLQPMGSDTTETHTCTLRCRPVTSVIGKKCGVKRGDPDTPSPPPLVWR